ncbi:MAG: efflux RND transporter periplasmic adaptor subunit [Opitutaceae bacterium]|jgi:RND family efflux transporter MFP subunit
MKSLRPFSTVFALALFAGCTRQAPDSGAGPSLPPLKAQVAVVHLETVPVLTEITGTVHAVERAQLAAKVMGSIDTMPFTLGQHVKRGDTLATISAGEINARVAQAESRFNQANRDLARERELLPEGASTATMVKDLEDRCAGDEAILREAKVMLSYATLQAPFDGVITQKFASVGDLASPGLPLLAIEGSNGFEVQAGVPDSLAFDLSVGKLLVVQTSTQGVAFSGKISEISPAANADSHTVAVKIAVPDSVAVRSGQFVRIQVSGAPIRALLAPLASVTTLGQMERVFVVGSDNRAVLRLVTTGTRRGNQVEILSGLDDGDRVILSLPAGMQEGQLLEIQP